MYLLYFIAVVTLHVTCANSTERYDLQTIDVPTSERLNESVIDVPKSDNVNIDARLMLEEKFNSDRVKNIVDGINEFTSLFFKFVRPAEWRSSAFSPIIIHSTLSLAALLSSGETELIARSILRLSKDGIYYNGLDYKPIIDNLNSIDSNVLHLRFKYFYSHDLEVKSGFRDESKKIFGSENNALDFSYSIKEARDTILDWFATETQADAISRGHRYLHRDLVNITNELNETTRLVIATTGYFNGTLERGFESVEPAVFLGNNDRYDAQLTRYNYGEGDYRHGDLDEVDAKFIELPIKRVGSSPAISVIIILPNKVGGCDEVIKRFPSFKIEKLLRGTLSRVKILIPDIRFDSTVEVNEPIRRLGLGGMLSPEANFGGISQYPVHIDKIFQQTIININTASDLRPGQNLRPLEKNENIVYFNATFCYVNAIVVKEPVPVYTFVGQSQ